MGGGRAPCCDKSKVKRGPWSPAEDLKLINFIHKFGHDNWRSLPKQAGLLRCGKSCRLRWINYLRPDLKRGNFTIEEEEKIIKLHQSLGNKWSKIASHFPGRTDNEIKNVWNTHLKKKLLTLRAADHDDSNIQGSSCIISSSSSSSISGVKQNDNAEVQEEYCNKLKCHNNEQTQSPLNIEELFDAQSSDCIFEEVNKPEMIPFESENNDFWNLLDNIESSFELSNFNNNQEINRILAEVDGYAEEARANVGYHDEYVFKSGDDTESSKWFKYLETELGLEETTN